MAATTTLKLPEKLKARIARLARDTKRSAHSIMVNALEREVTREERMRQFVQEAVEARTDIEQGGAVYRAEDVHEWMERLAKNGKAPRPKPWRR
jgi:predicted transcriptional regulator